jgi:hypothetical protein
MNHPAYPAARKAAARVYPHFARYDQASTAPHPVLPEPGIIEAMIDVAFWASLRREELYTPRISLAFIAREHLDQAFIFQRPVPLAPQPLTRLGPAVERPGIHLAVWPDADTLQVWGATRTLPAGCFVLQVLAPGLLVIKQSRTDETGKFVNLAVLQGEEIKIVNHHATGKPDCPELITTLLGLESHFTSSGPTNVLIQLAISMRAHGRGGALLAVPSTGPHTWHESMLQPITYAVDPAFSVLADFIGTDRTSRPALAREQLHRLIEGVAGLTAVDGATIINDRYEVFAFGAKIIRRPGYAQVNHVRVTEPTEGFIPLNADPSQLGGTRHLSAAQFAHDQRDAIALVASQDGRFTVFAWSDYEQMVHAHRIETLLL